MIMAGKENIHGNMHINTQVKNYYAGLIVGETDSQITIIIVSKDYGNILSTVIIGSRGACSLMGYFVFYYINSAQKALK